MDTNPGEMLFLVARDKQSMQNFRIKSTWKTIHVSYFGWTYKTLVGSSCVEPVSVPKIENTYYSYCGHKSKCKAQAPPWSDLEQKAI